MVALTVKKWKPILATANLVIVVVYVAIPVAPNAMELAVINANLPANVLAETQAALVLTSVNAQRDANATNVLLAILLRLNFRLATGFINQRLRFNLGLYFLKYICR